MARVAIREGSAWRPVGPAPEDPGGTPIPPGVESYWQAAFPVTGGWQLDPSVAKRAGIPPGVTLTPSTSSNITTNSVITDRSFSGTINTDATGSVFVRCRFTAGGYESHVSPGSSIWAVNISGQPAFIDCEFYGGKDITVYGGKTFIRCLFVEGNDMLRVRHTSGVTLTECVMDGCLASSGESHTDAIQATTNPPSQAQYVLNLERCWISVYNRFTTIPGNAVVQSGSYGDSTVGGMSGSFSDNFFDGGNYTFNANGGHLSPKFVLRRNRFGRNFRYGTWSGSFRDRADIDASNVWADTLQPITGS